MADRIMEAILGQKRLPGTRLGEQALSVLLDCSRIRVREARMQWSVRDFKARTTRMAMLDPSGHDAVKSCQAHIDIVHALARGDKESAELLMAEHMGQVQSALQINPSAADPLAELRQALAPMRIVKNISSRPSRSASQKPFSSTSPSTYAGALQ